MKQTAWLILVIAVLAVWFSVRPVPNEEPAVPTPKQTPPHNIEEPMPEVPETPLSIHGMGLGVLDYEVSLKYKVLRVEGATTYYGREWVEEVTNETRYFLAVTSDKWGRAIALRGDSLHINAEKVQYEAGKFRPDLGTPTTHGHQVYLAEDGTSVMSELQVYDKLGLEVFIVNGKPVEFRIGPPRLPRGSR